MLFPMSYSPQDPNAAFLLSMLDDVTTQSPASAPPELRNASRDFLLELDRNPAAAPATPVEHATALLLQWSKASVRGDQTHADSLAHKIEAAAPANPFPLHQTLRAHINANVVAALAPGQSSYIPYNGNLSFGVIAGTLPDDAKIGIIGDWGTGEEDAAFLLDSLLDRHGDIAALLHIGDIYETGRQSEVKTKFLTPIQTALASHKLKIPVFAIPGDHEYLSHGGAGYYWMLGEINKWDSKWLQKASYFCLRTRRPLADPGRRHRLRQPRYPARFPRRRITVAPGQADQLHPQNSVHDPPAVRLRV